jgi:hypothetical protein
LFMKMDKFSLSGLLLLGVMALSNQAKAGDDKPMPPIQYPLEQVAISILHYTSHGVPGGYEIAIQGNGNGFYLHNAVKTELKISNNILIDWLNDLYRMRFFDFSDTYKIEEQVILGDNGLVATRHMTTNDASGTKLCVQLADYQKCVTIIKGQPAEAAHLIAKIEKLFNH